MKNQDSTEKDVKSPTDSPASAAKRARDAATAAKELTDEEFAAVIGGTKMAPDAIKKS
jgi:hypothetical protein